MQANVEAVANRLLEMIQQDALLWKIAYGVVLYLSLYCILRALYNTKKREWESLFFLLICAVGFLWSAAHLAGLFWPEAIEQGLLAIRYISLSFLPGLLCLHIWKQVSYKDITFWVVVLVLAVPVAMCGLIFYALLFPEGLPLGSDTLAYQIASIAFWAYTFVAIVKSYLLCLNVFYQMPRHMRKSAHYLLSGITFVTIAAASCFWPGGALSRGVCIVTAIVLLLCLLDAFSAASSANVIVTSRDFVFGNLSTMILVLSKRQRILDWNKKSPDAVHPLPQPVYKEPFAHYRERIIQEGNGRVSPHGNNILTTLVDGAEHHYLLTTRAVQGKRRQYGYIVEISEVTRIYSVLRYLEDIAVVDQLTGLYNRNAYLGMVRRLVQPQNMPMAVLVGDVNHLKQLNDTCGHLCGDALLTTVAGLIRQAMPQDSFVARIGGDEFVLLVPQSNEAAAQQFIYTMNQNCAAVNTPEFGTPSISWGYAMMVSADEVYNDVFARADRMMYEAKRANFKFRSSGFVPTQDAPVVQKAPEMATETPLHRPPTGPLEEQAGPELPPLAE